MDELKILLLCNGYWGEHVDECQKNPSSCRNIICKQRVKSYLYAKKTANDWKLQGVTQYLLLTNCAVRVSRYVNQSANLERVFKAHKVVHLVTCNRLKNKSVHTLLYLYVNLRMLKKCEKELSNFLEDALNEEIGKGD